MATDADKEIPDYLRGLTDRNHTHFPLYETLASGGTSVVYLSKLADQAVAIKIFKKDDKKGDVSHKDLQREIEVLKREGSLITTVTPSKNERFESIGIVLPLFPGKTLRELIFEGNLTTEMKNSIAISLLKELYALQLLNIVHRDLRPENILVDENGVAKIIAFGHAQNKILNHKDDIARTESNYLAPECTSHSDPSICNMLTDEYAIGIILAELYSSRNYPQEIHARSVGQNTPHQIMDDILGKNASPQEGMPEEIFTIIRHISDPQPEKRAENVALAHGTEKLFALKVVDQIQEDADGLRDILMAKAAKLPPEVKNILEQHHDLSTIRNQLHQLKKKSETVQSFIRELDHFCEVHARKIQHKNLVITQGIELTIETIVELQKLEAKYKSHEKPKSASTGPRPSLILSQSQRPPGELEKAFTATIQLICGQKDYPNVDLKHITQILDQLSVNMAKYHAKDEDLPALLSLRDRLQNLQSIGNIIPEKRFKAP